MPLNLLSVKLLEKMQNSSSVIVETENGRQNCQDNSEFFAYAGLRVLRKRVDEQPSARITGFDCRFTVNYKPRPVIVNGIEKDLHGQAKVVRLNFLNKLGREFARTRCDSHSGYDRFRRRRPSALFASRGAE